MPARRPALPFTPLLALMLTLLAAPARSAANTPEAAVAAFYAWTLAHPSAALPTRREDVRLARLLTPHLVDLLQQARTTEARCVRTAAKGDKPLLLEGDLFVGNYEGASEVAYGELRQEGERAGVDAKLLYVDRRFPRAHPQRTVAWQDRVELQRIGGDWQIADVGYASGDSLIAVLDRYIADGARECAGH